MRNILIISNNRTLCSDVAAMLKKAEYSHIYSSCDYEEVFSMAYRLDLKLIIVDMELSRDAFANLSKIFSGPMKKIILYIAPESTVNADIQQAIQRGCSQYVTRPIKEQSFIEKVSEIMDSED